MLLMVNKVIQKSLLSIKVSSKVISIVVLGFLSVSTATHAAVADAIQDGHKMNKEKRSTLILRKAGERGLSKNDWLVSRHSFSFADYYDPKHSGFRDLLVINEDKIQGEKGFGSHPHKNMEIISYVMSGALKHKDSMGNETIIRPNEVQRMSAGTGVIHSEFNHIKDKETHFYQIWITPKTKGSSPSYAQKSFENAFKENKLILVASNTGREGFYYNRSRCGCLYFKAWKRKVPGVQAKIESSYMDSNGQRKNDGQWSGDIGRGWIVWCSDTSSFQNTGKQ